MERVFIIVPFLELTDSKVLQDSIDISQAVTTWIKYLDDFRNRQDSVLEKWLNFYFRSKADLVPPSTLDLFAPGKLETKVKNQL